MNDTPTAQAILTLCNTMSQVPDSVTQHRSIIVSVRLLVFLTAATQQSLLPYYVNIMHSTLIVLSTVVVAETNQLELDLIDYIKELYIVSSRIQCNTSVVHLLTNMCGISTDIIQNINESLHTEMSDKKYRLMFKNILREHVIGKGSILSSTNNKISDLNESVPVHSHIKAQIKQQHANNILIDPSNLAQLFQS